MQYMPLILVLRQLCEFKTTLVYLANSRQAREIHSKTLSQEKKKFLLGTIRKKCF